MHCTAKYNFTLYQLHQLLQRKRRRKHTYYLSHDVFIEVCREEKKTFLSKTGKFKWYYPLDAISTHLNILHHVQKLLEG